MNTAVEISLDPITLVASVVLNQESPRIRNELKIIFSNLSETYELDSKGVFTIPWYELRRGLSTLARILRKENADIHFDSLTQRLVDEVLSEHASIKSKISASAFTETEIEGILKEIGFTRQLKKEQVRDAKNLLNLKHGANFSVPGAGKTTTILAVHTILKKIGLVSKLFVVSPINAFISWEDEIRDIFKDGKFSILRLPGGLFRDSENNIFTNTDLVLANYEKLRRDVSPLIPFFIKNKVHLILDESHRIKSGRNNISFNQIIKLADLAKRRDILSGTPMPQGYADLEPQFDFLWPGQTVVPQVVADENAELRVNQAIKGLFVRTTKKELGLENPVIKYTSLAMGPIQAELYRLFKSEAARVIAGIDKPNLYNFRKIGRSVVKLLQAATNPMLLSGRDEYPDDISPVPNDKEFWQLLEEFRKYEKSVKIEYLKQKVREITQENPKNKVLIWSYFVRNILILEKIFQDYNPVTIYGGIPSGSDEDEANREGRIRKFHVDDTCRVMVANPQACGEGISLHKVCHHAIYLDRNFNAAYFLQSIDRIHRLGLQEGVKTNVEILVTENSIDEILISRLNDKISAMGNILEDPYLRSLAYDPADIVEEDETGIDRQDFEAIRDHTLNDKKS